MISYWWGIGAVSVATFVSVLIGITFGRMLPPRETFQDIVDDCDASLGRVASRFREYDEEQRFASYVTLAWVEHTTSGAMTRGPVLAEAHATRREAIDHLIELWSQAMAKEPYFIPSGSLLFQFRLGKIPRVGPDYVANGDEREFRRHLWRLEL